ncbi:hypothetical protein [Aestuariibius sp. HNIBRBA575]|uniref:hypothetical protein n=1 Tax=Aestuariibius sp. HNIBRBA575 TaxID=3233343 RepID=UPI0034A30C43
MEIQPTTQVPPAPRLVADQRPVADVAATVRDPQPNVPLAIPPSTSQQAVVSASMLEASETGHNNRTEIKEIERVLKPYGVTLLPHSAQTAEKRQAAEDAAQEAETKQADAKDASAKAETAAVEANETERAEENSAADAERIETAAIERADAQISDAQTLSEPKALISPKQEENN